MLRRIPLGSMKNLRDMGGLPVPGGGCTAWERLLRGDNPEHLSQADVDWLLERDITTVIDLRSAPEVERHPDQLSATPGFRYLHIPLVAGDKLPNTEADVGAGYFRALEVKDCIRDIMRAIAAAPGGVLYHCTAGKDRTGITAMLLYSLVGVERADILADYQISETYLEELLRGIRAAMPVELAAFVGSSKPEYLEECMDLAERKYGSLTGYLRATGLTQAELDLLRAKLLN